MRLSFILLVSGLLFNVCCNVPKVKLTNQVDPDIVLVNIGDVDRAAIAKMLLKVDSCKPILIAIDAWFVREKDSVQDLKLIEALRIVKNDILSYALDSLGNPVRSHNKFRSHAMDEGLAVLEETNGLSDRFIPVSKIKRNLYEHFALKIARHWKPDFDYKFKVNKSIPVNFTRTLNQYKHVHGEDVNKDLVADIFKGKIVIFGYLGPTDEDKHFTPIRLVKDYPDKKPDTYGVVILANALRTILDFQD